MKALNKAELPGVPRKLRAVKPVFCRRPAIRLEKLISAWGSRQHVKINIETWPVLYCYCPSCIPAAVKGRRRASGAAPGCRALPLFGAIKIRDVQYRWPVMVLRLPTTLRIWNCPVSPRNGKQQRLECSDKTTAPYVCECVCGGELNRDQVGAMTFVKGMEHRLFQTSIYYRYTFYTLDLHDQQAIRVAIHIWPWFHSLAYYSRRSVSIYISKDNVPTYNC